MPQNTAFYVPLMAPPSRHCVLNSCKEIRAVWLCFGSVLFLFDIQSTGSHPTPQLDIYRNRTEVQLGTPHNEAPCGLCCDGLFPLDVEWLDRYVIHALPLTLTSVWQWQFFVPKRIFLLLKNQKITYNDSFSPSQHCHCKRELETLYSKIISGAQELPTDFDPSVFMDAVYADLEAACPAGIEKCECMNAPGTFTFNRCLDLFQNLNILCRSESFKS